MTGCTFDVEVESKSAVGKRPIVMYKNISAAQTGVFLDTE